MPDVNGKTLLADLEHHTYNCGSCLGEGKGSYKTHLLWLVGQIQDAAAKERAEAQRVRR